ncbi:MAG TPA: FHA domain-containing protein [Planctomycetota bacterium]|nr:FHA domain-containing protein [Planctomycetota bacterium]
MASVVLSFGGKEIKSYDLTKPATVIGRDPGADIVIDNLGVSRAHCQFLRRGETFLLQDMNSSNGTYVNGQKVGEHNLNDGDRVVVGKYTLIFRNAQQAVAPAPAAAGDKIVPDSLNTYMMDGNKIREKMEEMRRAEQSKGAPAAPAAEPPPAPAAPAAAAAPVPEPPPTRTAPVAAPSPARAEGGERHTKIVMSSGAHAGLSTSTLKKYLYFSLAVNVLLAAALAVLYYFYLTNR